MDNISFHFIDDLLGFCCLTGSEMVYGDWEIIGFMNVWIGRGCCSWIPPFLTDFCSVK
jgi:hypothetical protein